MGMDKSQPKHGVNLTPTLTSGAEVAQIAPGAWHFQIPAGPKGQYRLAQLEDYDSLARRSFPWRAPVALTCQARSSSSQALPGTWGFGLWNDPFSFSLGFGGGTRKLPALPNAAWFFFASPPNYLSFRDDIPAQGNLAATFSAPQWSPALLGLAAPGLPLLALRPVARLFRRIGRRIIHQDAVHFDINLQDWHTYRLEWQPYQVRFRVDDGTVYETPVAPRAPLGLVMWVDNQYAALPPDGRLKFGSLRNPEPAWIELKDININNLDPV
jgi:hypothetical protein